MSDKTLIGRVEVVSFPLLGMNNILARIDTGAQTSAVWASSIELINGKLEVVLFGKGHPAYIGEVLKFDHFTETVVASSNGHTEKRYKVQMVIKLAGRRIRARLTLADRSTQVYPVLIGRNVLRGKFIVDVTQGSPNLQAEAIRSQKLQAQLKKKSAKK